MPCQRSKFPARNANIFRYELRPNPGFKVVDRGLELRQRALQSLAMSRPGYDRGANILRQSPQPLDDRGFDKIDAKPGLRRDRQCFT